MYIDHGLLNAEIAEGISYYTTDVDGQRHQGRPDKVTIDIPDADGSRVHISAIGWDREYKRLWTGYLGQRAGSRVRLAGRAPRYTAEVWDADGERWV